MALLFLLVLSIGLVSLSVWFFIKPDPSCFDGKKNQNELGVDCGGNCTKVCSFEAKSLLPLWTRVFEINTNVYSVVSYVENLNSNLGIENLNYTITVVGQNGETLDKRNGNTFINNRERFTIFASNFVFANDQVPARAFISFDEETWQYVKNNIPGITIRQKKFENSPIPRLEAEIINDSVYDLIDIPVTVVLADSSGKAFSASFTNVENLTRGSKETIFFTWPQSFIEVPALFDFYPHINGFEI